MWKREFYSQENIFLIDWLMEFIAARVKVESKG
jgi:hypothetical protein